MTELTQPPTNRSALLPPAPTEPISRVPRDVARVRPDDQLQTERARRAALQELSRLMTELEAWRRRQLETRAPQRWLLIHRASGGTIRVRFDGGRPVQIRAGADDRDRALELVSSALDLALLPVGGWCRDSCALDWRLRVRSF